MEAPEHGGLPPHTPGAGAALLRQLWGPDRVPEEFSPEAERQVDELIATAQRLIAERGGQATA
ncbi:hypothetical protein [Dactylosporangium sp. NPDC005555]|uniref:hypothetical protein n=1 Tax=Dactylosporangium sp. NPDC005555 TaxID=3154889 RepID=UPI0033AE0E74